MVKNVLPDQQRLRSLLLVVILCFFSFLMAAAPVQAAGDYGLEDVRGKITNAPETYEAGFGVEITIARVITTALGFVGMIFLLMMVYAGFLWMMARGNEEQVKKSKDTILRALMGLMIVTAAYGITVLITAGLANSTG